MSAFVPEPWHWMAAGVLIAVLEVAVPGGTLIWLGGAAFAVGLILLVVPLAVIGQILLFGLLAALAVAAALYLRGHRKAAGGVAVVNRGAQRFIGLRATLVQPIVDGSGQIHLGDTMWAVKGPDLPAGATVVVTGMDGATLTVEPG